MPKEDDDDDSLPPLGENTNKFIEQAKKGQARNFLLVYKGIRADGYTSKPLAKEMV